MAEAGQIEQLRHQLKLRLVEAFQSATRQGRELVLTRDVVAAQLRQLMQGNGHGAEHGRALTAAQQEQLIREVFDDVAGLGPLQALLADPTITEIMVNGPHEIYVERDGKLEQVPNVFRDTGHLMTVIERMLEFAHLSVNESNPICDAMLPDGVRLNIIIPPLVLNGPVVTIRRKSRQWVMDDYIATGAISPQAADFLQRCVQAKVNCLVSGGTSTGKTTLVSVLASSIPAGDRVITIENVPELELPNKHWIKMVGRGANVEGRGEIPLRALVKNALRMRPDRIILGEARGGEALDVVQAMHSGHDGFLTVLHANSPLAALERLQTLMLMSGVDLPPQACRMQIASSTDLLVHLSRGADGKRRVSSITQVIGASEHGFEIEELFRFEMDAQQAGDGVTGTLRHTGARPKFLEKFHLNRVALPSWLGAEGGSSHA